VRGFETVSASLDLVVCSVGLRRVINRLRECYEWKQIDPDEVIRGGKVCISELEINSEQLGLELTLVMAAWRYLLKAAIIPLQVVDRSLSETFSTDIDPSADQTGFCIAIDGMLTRMRVVFAALTTQSVCQRSTSVAQQDWNSAWRVVTNKV